LDVDAMENYLDDADAIPEDMANFDIDTLVDNAIDSNPAIAPYEEDFTKFAEAVVEKMTDNMSYTIVETEKDGKDYVVTVEMTMPDFDEVNKSFEDTLKSSVSNQKMNELITKLFTNGTITASSSQQEILDAVMPEVINLMIESVDDFKVDTETEEKELTISKIDGEWLINTKKSNID